MSEVLLAEYGRPKPISFELYEVDGVDLRVDAVDAGADCSIRLDEAAEGTCDNDFVDEGVTYSLVLTAAEMVAKKITVTIVDAATKVWLDKVIVIETYGHPLSAHPNLSPFWTNGAVNDGSATSSIWTFDGFTEATADHVIGGLLKFTSGVNLGQSRPVSDYTSTVITVNPAFIAAPADNDEFVIEARPAASALDWVNGERLDILLDAITAAGPTKSEMDTAHGLLATPTDVANELGTYDGPTRAEATADKDVIVTDLDDIKGTSFVKDTHSLIDVQVGVAAIPTTAMRGTDNVVLAGPTKGEMDTGHATIVTDLDDIKGTGFVKDTHSLFDIEGYVDLIDDGTSGLAKIATDAAAILVDTNELQTDWKNTGRLDTILDSILDDTDLIDDGTSGLAKIATDIAAVLVDTAVIGALGAGLTAIATQASLDALNNAPAISAATIADAVFDEQKAGHVAGGSFGEEIQAHALEVTVDALTDITASEVNDEMVDVMNTDTYGEVGQGAPGATVSIFTMIRHLYKNWRNKKIQSATLFELYNDAGDTVDTKATVSDDGSDATKQEMVSGP